MTLGLFNRIKRARHAAAEHKEYTVSVTLTEGIDKELLRQASLRAGIGAGRTLSISRSTITLLDRSDSQNAEEGMADLLTITGEYLRSRTGTVPEYNKWVRNPEAAGGTARRTGLGAENENPGSHWPGQHGTCIEISLADAFNEAGRRGKTITELLSEAMEDAAWRTDEGEMATALSNLGGIALPKSMVRFVEKLDYRTSDPGSCACVSCGGKIYTSCNTPSGNDVFTHNFMEELAYLGIKTYSVALNPA